MEMEKIYRAFPKQAASDLDLAVTYLEAGGMYPVRAYKTKGSILCRDECLSLDGEVRRLFDLPEAVRYALDIASAFETYLAKKMHYLRRESRIRDEAERELWRVRKDKSKLKEFKRKLDAAKAA